MSDSGTGPEKKARPDERLRRLRRVLRDVFLDLLTLVWPTECVGCAAPDRDLCDPCRDRLRAPARLHTSRVGSPAVRVYAGSIYEGVTRAVLVGYKHQGRLGFAKELAHTLAVPLASALTGCAGRAPPLLVCVPSRPRSVRRRGFRHVEVLVRQALQRIAVGSAERAVPTLRVVRPLRPLRGRTGQVGLVAAERERNARRLTVRRGRALQGREVILIDDIITTGATVTAACEVLRCAGATVTAVVALCVVPRRDTRDERTEGAE